MGITTRCVYSTKLANHSQLIKGLFNGIAAQYSDPKPTLSPLLGFIPRPQALTIYERACSRYGHWRFHFDSVVFAPLRRGKLAWAADTHSARDQALHESRR